MADHPQIPNLPGIKWRKLASGKWEARWVPRRDLVERGYRPNSPQLWCGTDISETEIAYLQTQAEHLQTEMIMWGRGVQQIPVYEILDGTVASLVRRYQTDIDSPYRRVEYMTRSNYDRLCRRLVKDVGSMQLTEVRNKTIDHWYADWKESGIPMAHQLIGMMRTIVYFGAASLEDAECSRIAILLKGKKFPQGERRKTYITVEQVVAFCERAHYHYRSLALAAAFQFETWARQKDVIGAWVPLSDPAPSEVIDGQWKWIKGMRWNEIDENLRMEHVTSKKKKLLIANLRFCPLILEELAIQFHGFARTDATGATVYNRAALPSSGPIIVDEVDGLPYDDDTYRDRWRVVARECGIPDDVQNRDSRSGGITRALAAGINPDDVRKMATHSQLSTTMIYSRGEEKAADRVLEELAKKAVNR